MDLFKSLLDIWKVFYQRKLDKDNRKIELVRAKIDTSICLWQPDEANSQAFFRKHKTEEGLSPSPIFDFTIMNHFPKPVLLTRMDLHLNFLPSGLTGPVVKPTPVTPSASYCFNISNDQTDYSFELQDPLRIAPQESGRFQVELLFPKKTPLENRYAMYFSLCFNNRQKIKAPLILLNSDNEKGKFKHLILT